MKTERQKVAVRGDEEKVLMKISSRYVPQEVTKQAEHSRRKPVVASSQTTEPETDPVTSPEWPEIRNLSQVI